MMTELLVCDATRTPAVARGKQRTQSGNPDPGRFCKIFLSSLSRRACRNCVMKRLMEIARCDFFRTGYAYEKLPEMASSGGIRGQNGGVCLVDAIARSGPFTDGPRASGATTQRAVPRRREEHAHRPQILDQTRFGSDGVRQGYRQVRELEGVRARRQNVDFRPRQGTRSSHDAPRSARGPDAARRLTLIPRSSPIAGLLRRADRPEGVQGARERRPPKNQFVSSLRPVGGFLGFEWRVRPRRAMRPREGALIPRTRVDQTSHRT